MKCTSFSLYLPLTDCLPVHGWLIIFAPFESSSKLSLQFIRGVTSSMLRPDFGATKMCLSLATTEFLSYRMICSHAGNSREGIFLGRTSVFLILWSLGLGLLSCLFSLFCVSIQALISPSTTFLVGVRMRRPSRQGLTDILITTSNG